MVGLEAMQFGELPLGFRFKPTDVELIDHYLRLKINGHENQVSCIKEVDICKVEPWDLPDLSAIKTNDCEWFYFCPRDRKYPNGQRSNRATDAGYWKATGKDRTIKSRKLGSIGMKKTLVFYTGRAPKGQRSNWVIHEYRTTLKELDGSQPGQEAFVLCRLFKKADELKQDDHDEGSHTDEVETNICSPNPTNISHEDIQSGPAVQASPVSVEQSVEQKIIVENCVVKTSNSLTSETIFPDHPRMNEEMTPEVDSHFTGGIKSYEDSSDVFMKWLDGPVCIPPEFGDGYNGSKLQDISGGRDTISDFLDSVFMDPYAPISKEAGLQGNPIIESDIWNYSSIKGSGSCSGSDVEAGQQQGNRGLLQSNLLVNDDEIFSDAALDLFCKQESVCYTPPLPGSFLEVEDGAQIVGNNGIKIRPHIHSRQVPSANSILQGTAERRIRLAMIKNSKPTVSEEPTIPPYKDVICLEDLAKNMIKLDEYESSVGSTREAETEIKISTNLQRSQPSASKLVKHGIARRRILLEKVTAAYNGGDVTKPPILAERRNLTEEFSDDETDCSPDIKPITFKKPTSLMQMVKVVTVLFLFMACFGLWIARNVFFLSS